MPLTLAPIRIKSAFLAIASAEYLQIPTKPNAVANYYGDTKLPDTALQIFTYKRYHK